MVPVEYMVMYWGLIMWGCFVYELYPKEMPQKVVTASIIVGAFTSLFIIVTPISIFTRYLTAIEVLMAVEFIVTAIALFKAVLSNRDGAILLLLCGIIILSVFSVDVLYQWNIISNRYGPSIENAVFILTFIQAYILSERFSIAFEKVEGISEKLISLDRLKDEFLVNTSHELRTPLNGIINITNSVIENANGNLDTDQQRNLQIVVSEARKLYNLINDILDMTSIKNGEIKIYKRAADIRSIAEVTLYVLQQLKGDKEIEFVSNIPDEMPPVNADVERLRQIFYNLLGNSLKFTSSGKIEVGAILNKDKVEIWIKDTGCGIPNDKIKNIFEPFYQIDSTETREFGGSGLGLSITKKLVELHGGKILINSAEGEGTVVTFTLPLFKENNKEVYVESTINTIQINSVVTELTTLEEKSNRSYSILIVDDDQASFTALFNILDNEGYYVKAVTSGEEALKELEEESKYDLVILDIMMPKMSGYEVLKKIRLRFEQLDLPVLLLTAKARPEDLNAGFEAGASDYLSKPFEALELKARVKTLVQLKKSVDKMLSNELSFLQAQIKPHFLYNALSVITSLSTREPKKAKELLLNLSDYLRGSFNFNNHSGLISLGTELQTVEAYIAIEKARFRERLNVEYNIDKDIFASVPMLSIQPLVENAVHHGIMGKVEGGMLKLSVKSENNHVVIEVEDDGVGIKEEKLIQLLRLEDTNGVGIKNIHKRLITIYGTGLQIESKAGYGTKVTMVIPLNSLQR